VLINLPLEPVYRAVVLSAGRGRTRRGLAEADHHPGGYIGAK